ncbi:MAG: hypothetical protein AAFP98_12255, partial [Pseudomonadota bacterium]
MRQSLLLSLCAVATMGLAACSGSGDAQVDRALQDINGVEDENFNDLFLNVGEPEEAVGYFTRALSTDPDRIDLQRGLGKALVRAKKPTDAVTAWQAVVSHPEATNDDRVELADAFIRTNQWDKAKATLDSIPPTHETFKRYRLEAMIADGREQWDKADAFYETAVGLTTKPANVYNNWGYSKLTRG